MAARRHRALPRAESEGKEVRVTARATTRLRAPVWLAQLVLPLLGLWLLRSGAEVAELRATGMPLGLMPDMRYEEQVTLVPRGGSLLFHSDGLTEAHGPGREMFGAGRIAALAARQLDGEALIRLLLDELHQFTGPDWEQEDDITLVALERSAAGIDAGRPAEPGRLAEATAEARSTPIRRGRPATAVAEAVERGGSG
jgi:hypothetical protein